MNDKISTHNVIIKCSHNKRSEEVEILHEAMIFFLDDLLKRCTIDYKLNVEVKLRSNKRLTSDDGAENVGLAHSSFKKGQRWFHIELANDRPFLELLSTLAHESIHVSQLATGRLQITDDDWIWEGTSYGQEPYIGEDSDHQLPWEYDAYSKEIDLTKKFVKKYYSSW